jgi:hypothetical protein
MARIHGWAVTFIGLFFIIAFFAGLVSEFRRLSKPHSPASELPPEKSIWNRRYVSELSRNGRIKATRMPEPMRQGVAIATGHFSDTHWEDFIAVADRVAAPDTWIVCVEPKSGGPHDTITVKLKGDDYTDIGVRWGKKLKGWRGKGGPKRIGKTAGGKGA